jgi:hypothetical protein
MFGTLSCYPFRWDFVVHITQKIEKEHKGNIIQKIFFSLHVKLLPIPAGLRSAHNPKINKKRRNTCFRFFGDIQTT